MTRVTHPDRQCGLITIAQITVELNRLHVDAPEQADLRNQRTELERELEPFDEADLVVIERAHSGLKGTVLA